MAEAKTTKPRVIRGEVVSVSSNKTATLRVDRRVKHPLYGKYIKKSTKFHIHDEDNECQLGDLVSAVECRPISKSKSFKLTSIDVKSTRG
ncbi:MAG: 30S ribosomal protein S17 [Gammaproteobacteria bacterium]|nr:30S ribosomal protein S17 [Gammaproteobacteria bacterium]